MHDESLLSILLRTVAVSAFMEVPRTVEPERRVQPSREPEPHRPRLFDAVLRGLGLALRRSGQILIDAANQILHESVAPADRRWRGHSA